jgi:carboxylesterase
MNLPTRHIVKNAKKIKNILFKDPYAQYKEELNLTNQPFYFKGDNNTAILLIHGWTSTPYEVRRLGIYLNEAGYTVSAPMLRGHGTFPKELEGVHWEDWLHDLKREYIKLRSEHDKVILGGTSIGACLAMLLAIEFAEIAGLVLLATPYEVRSERIAVVFANVSKMFHRYNKKYYPPTFGARTTVTRLISYQSYPIDSAFEVFELIKKTRENVSEVKQPSLMIQSSSDHVVTKKSLELLYENIGSMRKEKKYIQRAYHTFISDIKQESIFKDILNFVESL